MLLTVVGVPDELSTFPCLTQRQVLTSVTEMRTEDSPASFGAWCSVALCFSGSWGILSPHWLRGLCLIAHGDWNILVKRALRSARGGGDDKECGALLYCGTSLLLGSPWAWRVPEHRAVLGGLLPGVWPAGLWETFLLGLTLVIYGSATSKLDSRVSLWSDGGCDNLLLMWNVSPGARCWAVAAGGAAPSALEESSPIPGELGSGVHPFIECFGISPPAKQEPHLCLHLIVLAGTDEVLGAGRLPGGKGFPMSSANTHASRECVHERVSNKGMLCL